jgi:hypothetical protein
MKIERQDDEWKLTHAGESVAIVREGQGAFFVLRHPDDDRPLVFRSMLDALRHVQPPPPKRKRMVYLHGRLTRRSEDESE